MHVVAAHVPDRNFRARLSGDLRCSGSIVHAGVFLDRQAVKIGPHRHGLAIAVAQDSDDAGSDVDYLDVAKRLQLFDNPCLGFGLLQRELWVLVEPLIKLLTLRLGLFQIRFQRFIQLRHRSHLMSARSPLAENALLTPHTPPAPPPSSSGGVPI